MSHAPRTVAVGGDCPYLIHIGPGLLGVIQHALHLP